MPVSYTRNHIVVVAVYRHLEFYFEEYFFWGGGGYLVTHLIKREMIEFGSADHHRQMELAKECVGKVVHMA